MFADVASRPVALRHPRGDVAVALAGPAQRLEVGQDARIEPDMRTAILGALRLNSDLPSASVAAITV